MDNTKLELINGKFMRGSIEVPIEIGNDEQISLLKSIERDITNREELAKEGKLRVFINVTDIRYNIECRFKCICGHIIREIDSYNTADSIDELEYAEEEYWDTVVCPKCNREYQISENNAKLISDE